MMSKFTREELEAHAAKNEEWGNRERNETFDACGAWTIQPIGLDFLNELKDHVDRFTAVHEAGHTVADYVLGHGPDVVTIEPNREEGTAGHAHQLDGDVMTEEGLRNIAVSLFAGECAALLSGEGAEIASWGAAGDQDTTEFRIFWLRDTEEERVQLLADLRAETEALLRKHWWRVGVVARLLLKHRTLDWDELSEILGSSDEREAENRFDEIIVMKALFVGVRVEDLDPNQLAAFERYIARRGE
jgi:hypothetical protein